MWKAAVCAALLTVGVSAQRSDVVIRDTNTPIVQGTKPRANASLYPTSLTVKDGAATVGAEFMGHTIGGEKTTFAVDDYIVVEVAIYPAKGQTINVSAGDFQLRINAKRVEMPQTPQLVAMRMKYPDVAMSPHTELSGGIGDTDISIGRPVPGPRFPGDPTDSRRFPRQDPVKSDKTEMAKQTAPEAVVYAALPEGPTSAPVSGVLYYEYKGKLKSLKSMELLIRGAGEKVDVLPIK